MYGATFHGVGLNIVSTNTFHDVGQRTSSDTNTFHDVGQKTSSDTNTFHDVGQKTSSGPVEKRGPFYEQDR